MFLYVGSVVCYVGLWVSTAVGLSDPAGKCAFPGYWRAAGKSARVGGGLFGSGGRKPRRRGGWLAETLLLLRCSSDVVRSLCLSLFLPSVNKFDSVITQNSNRKKSLSGYSIKFADLQ